MRAWAERQGSQRVLSAAGIVTLSLIPGACLRYPSFCRLGKVQHEDQLVCTLPGVAQPLHSFVPVSLQVLGAVPATPVPRQGGAQQQVRGHQDAEPSPQPGQAARYTSFMSSVQASSSPPCYSCTQGSQGKRMWGKTSDTHTHTREVLRCLSDATASKSKDLGTRHLPLTLQGLARS